MDDARPEDESNASVDDSPEHIVGVEVVVADARKLRAGRVRYVTGHLERGRIEVLKEHVLRVGMSLLI